jgi:hypothetical protein
MSEAHPPCRRGAGGPDWSSVLLLSDLHIPGSGPYSTALINQLREASPLDWPIETRYRN